MKQVFIDGFRRIRKARARKMFNEGKPVYCAPYKRNPVSAYGTIYNLSYTQPLEPNHDHDPLTFESVVSSYERFSCFNKKNGRYAAFYEQVAEYLGPPDGWSLLESVNTNNTKENDNG